MIVTLFLQVQLRRDTNCLRVRFSTLTRTTPFHTSLFPFGGTRFTLARPHWGNETSIFLFKDNKEHLLSSLEGLIGLLLVEVTLLGAGGAGGMLLVDEDIR